ncbi:hypothetical protein [Salibacterium aidingense]|uniref:hypothetical protein n=1 Tax=Salibacterium aidingense TaxID=384933 RepID=UPI000406F5BF|nr:hypothetical protein [Salibacterium aidingense]
MNSVLLLLVLFLFVCSFTLMLFLWGRVKRLAEEHAILQSQFEEWKKTKRKEDNEAKKEEIRHHLHMKALDIRNTVFKQTKAPHPRAVEETPVTSGYDSNLLQEMFGSRTAEQMEEYFTAYRTYVDTYWRTTKGGIKKVFRGSPSESYHEFAQVQQASRQLMKKLDDTLVHFQ